MGSQLVDDVGHSKCAKSEVTWRLPAVVTIGFNTTMHDLGYHHFWKLALVYVRKRNQKMSCLLFCTLPFWQLSAVKSPELAFYAGVGDIALADFGKHRSRQATNMPLTAVGSCHRFCNLDWPCRVNAVPPATKVAGGFSGMEAYLRTPILQCCASCRAFRISWLNPATKMGGFKQQMWWFN